MTYTPSEKLVSQIIKTFKFVEKANTDQINRYRSIRATAKSLAEELSYCCPESRELSLALTHLEDCVMWAIESISRNEKE